MTASDATPEGRISGRALSSLKTGRKAYRLRVGELPKPLSRVTRYCREYRQELEAVVLAEYGEVGVEHAHLIDSACGHEQHLQICRWLIRERLDSMSTADIRECSKQMALARDKRNAAVQALRLDRDREQEAVTLLYSGPDQHAELRDK